MATKTLRIAKQFVRSRKGARKMQKGYEKQDKVRRKYRSGTWSVSSKKRITRIVRTKKALKKKSYRKR